MFFSGVLIAACYLLSVFFVRCDGRVTDRLIGHIQSDSYDPEEKSKGRLLLFSLLFPALSIVSSQLFPSVQFLPYVFTLVYVVCLMKFHADPISIEESGSDDAIMVLTHFSCLAFIGYFVLPETFDASIPYVLLSYFIIVPCILFGKIKVSENLFHHYYKKSIALEKEVVRLRSELSRRP